MTDTSCGVVTKDARVTTKNGRNQLAEWFNPHATNVNCRNEQNTWQVLTKEFSQIVKDSATILVRDEVQSCQL